MIIDSFVYWQRESGAGIANARVVEGEEGAQRARPRRDSKITPASMRVLLMFSVKRGERRLGRIECGEDIAARESEMNYMPRVPVVEKPNSVETELKRMTEDNYSLMVSLQLTQEKLDWAREELKDNDVLTESVWKAAKASSRDGGGQAEELGEVTKCRRYEACVQGNF